MNRFLRPLKQVFLTAGAVLAFGAASFAQQGVEFGLIRNNPNKPFEITAVAYGNFTSRNVTMSSALFTFMVPSGLKLTPSIPQAPRSGQFENVTGAWVAQLLTADNYGRAGFRTADLEGYDVYQVVLQNAPNIIFERNVPVPLFKFSVDKDCFAGKIMVLENDSPIQKAIFDKTFANFNNEASLTINDAPSTDKYLGNKRGAEAIFCPVLANKLTPVEYNNETPPPTGLEVIAKVEDETPANDVRAEELVKIADNTNSAEVKVFPNPAIFKTTVEVNSSSKENVQIVLFTADGAAVRTYGKNIQLVDGSIKQELPLQNLNAGVYYVMVQIGAQKYAKKLIIVGE